MSDKTGIEWTDATWNPVTGCTEASPGCDHCYAKTFAERWRGTPGHYFENGFDVQLRPDKLDLPLRWTRPRRIFVNSMSDLFHDSVPDSYIAKVWAVMAMSPQHTFQILTKRHGRMKSLLNSRDFVEDIDSALLAPWIDPLPVAESRILDAIGWYGHGKFKVLPNVWLGVSTENQQWADLRIPALLETPAAVRFISAEPLLGPIDLRCRNADYATCGSNGYCGMAIIHQLDWVIVGGESGRGARPMHPDWARSLRDQCEIAGVPFLFKQWGEWQPNSPHQEMVANGRRYRYGRRWIHPDGSTANYFEPATPMDCVGKHRAGRELDGRTWDQYPQAVTADV